jgi:solute carrier family 25 phosphate transporter 23/24/25/41
MAPAPARAAASAAAPPPPPPPHAAAAALPALPWTWNLGEWVLREAERRRGAPPPALPAHPAAAIAAAAAAEAAAATVALEAELRRLAELEELEEEEEEEEAPPDAARTRKLLMSGALAGALSRSATAPVDRLKMLLQVHEGATRLTVRDGIRRMAAEGTVRAFFKGNGANVLKIAPETAIKLTANDAYKRLVTGGNASDITPGQRMAAGAAAGATAQATIYPLELVRTRLAVCAPGAYGGIADAARQVLALEGWRAFYRGMLPSMLGILPYAGVDIAAFELLKERLLDAYDGRPPAHAVLGAGMLSSSLAQFCAYPLALTRTRLQAQGMCGAPARYSGMVDVLTQTYRREGLRGWYKGSLTNLAKVAPAAGISWFTFEETKAFLGLVDARR